MSENALVQPVLCQWFCRDFFSSTEELFGRILRTDLSWIKRQSAPGSTSKRQDGCRVQFHRGHTRNRRGFDLAQWWRPAPAHRHHLGAGVGIAGPRPVVLHDGIS